LENQLRGGRDLLGPRWDTPAAGDASAQRFCENVSEIEESSGGFLKIKSADMRGVLFHRFSATKMCRRKEQTMPEPFGHNTNRT